MEASCGPREIKLKGGSRRELVLNGTNSGEITTNDDRNPDYSNYVTDDHFYNSCRSPEERFVDFLHCKQQCSYDIRPQKTYVVCNDTMSTSGYDLPRHTDTPTLTHTHTNVNLKSTHAHTRTHAHNNTHKYTHANIPTLCHTHTSTIPHTPTHTSIHIRTFAHTHTHPQTHTHTHTHTHKHTHTHSINRLLRRVIAHSESNRMLKLRESEHLFTNPLFSLAKKWLSLEKVILLSSVYLQLAYCFM